MTGTVPVITLDGPSGAGKGTISRMLAADLGWHFLDSGSLYRLTALAALHHGLPLDEEPALARLARTLDVRFDLDEANQPRILLEARPVGAELRSEACGDAASRVAALGQVRAALLSRQRAFREPPGLVADGRDMGTVVFTDAPLKIFLTASCEERARRRYKQLQEQGLSANLSALLQELAERDRRDSERAVAPLRPAEDALVVDSSRMGIQEVLDVVREKAMERGIIDTRSR